MDIKLSNGTLIPQLGIGTYRKKPDECERGVKAALAAGYRLVDTANIYLNERAVGRALKTAKREEVFLTTKLWPSDFRYDRARRAIEGTLARLDTPYIDLLLLHQQVGDVAGAWSAMEQAVAEGKVRSLGISNFDMKSVAALLSKCTIRPVLCQIECHPYYQRREFRAFLQKEQIVTESWFPLGSGDKRLLSEPLLRELAQKYGKTPAQIVLRWHIQEGCVVIPGSSNEAHIRENMQIFDFELTAQEMELLSTLDKNKPYAQMPKLIQRITFTHMRLNYDKQK